MIPTDTNSLNQVETFLVESGLLHQWALDGFCRRLPYAVEAEALEVGSVRQRGDCLRFTIL